MQFKKFQRKIEDFICKNCKAKVHGNGYTDHCPYCLYSLHVDINPGDRRAKCSGLMEPIGVEIKSQKYIINYKCQKCGYQHRIKAANNDNKEEIIKLMST